MAEPDEDDDFSQLVDMDIDRVDLVDKAANGTRILFAKSAEGDPAGLFDGEFVREMIAKADGEVPAATPDAVTVTGSPDAIARMIHQAAAGQRVVKATEPEYVEFVKAKYSAEDKRKLAAQGHAMRNSDGEPDYPVDDEEDLGKAIHAIGRGGADHDKIRRYVIRRAREMGKSDQIPDNWAADGSLKQPVSKADGITDPGSPAWEAQDADSADGLVRAILALRPRVQALAVREGTEVGAGHMEDLCDVYDLQSAQDFLTQAAKLLGGFAVSERAEAGAVAKATTEPAAPSAAPPPQESTVTDTRADEATAAATVAKSDADALTEAEYAQLGREFLRKMAAEKAATETSDATSAPEDARTIPGTDTVQAPAPAPDDIAKAMATTFATALGEAMAPVVKQVNDLAASVGAQGERVEKALAQPDDRRSPLLNGATGVAGFAARGDKNPTDDPRFQAVMKAVGEMPDGPDKAQLQRRIALGAIAGTMGHPAEVAARFSS